MSLHILLDCKKKIFWRLAVVAPRHATNSYTAPEQGVKPSKVCSFEIINTTRARTSVSCLGRTYRERLRRLLGSKGERFLLTVSSSGWLSACCQLPLLQERKMALTLPLFSTGVKPRKLMRRCGGQFWFAKIECVVVLGPWKGILGHLLRVGSRQSSSAIGRPNGAVAKYSFGPLALEESIIGREYRHFSFWALLWLPVFRIGVACRNGCARAVGIKHG